MNTLIIVLRILHIGSGVFWVGGALFSNFLLTPATASTGDAGRAVMNYLVTKSRISMRFTGAAVITVLSGAALYWIDSGGLTSAWTTSGPGWGFGLGGILAVFGMGFSALVGINASKVGRLATAAQGKPSEPQLVEMRAAQSAASRASLLSSVALIISLLCMATARYWLF